MLRCSILEVIIMPKNTEAHPRQSPVDILTELAVEGTSSLIEAQRIFLHLAQQENELVLNGIKERVGSSAPMAAMTDMVRRSFNTWIDMQQEFLNLTSQQTVQWIEAVQGGKKDPSAHLAHFAREGMQNLVQAHKKFLNMLSEETSKATSGKPGHFRPLKKTEMSKLARDAANLFVDAQKRTLDVVGQQLNVNLKAATRAAETLSSAPVIPITQWSEKVRELVAGEKALLQSIAEPQKKSKRARRERPAKVG